MMEITDSVVIDRPVEEVFAFAGDPANDDTWATVMTESRVTSDGPLAKGSTLRQVMRFLGRSIPVDCEVTEYEPGRRVAYSMTFGQNRGGHERTFEAQDGGTRVTLTTRGDSEGLFKVADPLLKRIGARQMASDLGILKELLEGGAVNPAQPG